MTDRAAATCLYEPDGVTQRDRRAAAAADTGAPCHAATRHVEKHVPLTDTDKAVKSARVDVDAKPSPGGGLGGQGVFDSAAAFNQNGLYHAVGVVESDLNRVGRCRQCPRTRTRGSSIGRRRSRAAPSTGR